VISYWQVVSGGWMEWGKKDLSESLDLTELENLFHARDDKTLASSKRCCVGVAMWE